MTRSEAHPSHSGVQVKAEKVIRDALARELGLEFGDAPKELGSVRLDGYAHGKKPVCVEIWSHQGTAKAAQKHKVMADMCKLLLVEHLLGRRCRKILAVADASALSFLDGSWQGRFADAFGIERQVVDVPEKLREEIRAAQKRQYR